VRFLRQTRLVFVRSARPWAFSPAANFIGIAGPLVYLLLFGPLLEGAIVGGGDPWQWFVPGMLLQLTLFSAAYSGFAMTPELRTGVMERLLVAPVSRAALLVGRVLSDVVQLYTQAVVLLAFAFLMGFRATVPAVALLFLLIGVLAAAISAASYALALTLKEENKLAPLLSSALVPLMLLSGVLLPMDGAPDWLHTLSRINPLSHVVDALRSMTLGDFANSTTLNGWLAAAGLAVVFLTWGIRAMSREPG